MTIPWLNRYHRGFNRVVLVFTVLPVVIALLYVLLSHDYRARSYRPHPDTSWSDRSKDERIGVWAQERWRKYDSDDSNKSSFSDVLFPSTLLQEVNSLPEARHFTDEHLRAIIDRAITYAKSYPARVSEARWRGVKHFFVTAGVCAGLYVLAHLWFCILVWVIRGFRDTN